MIGSADPSKVVKEGGQLAEVPVGAPGAGEGKSSADIRLQQTLDNLKAAGELGEIGTGMEIPGTVTARKGNGRKKGPALG